MPGLPSEIIEYPFAGGLDEKTDPWLIEAPKVTSLSNAVFSKGGQIRKRRGFTGQLKTIQGGGSISAAARIGFRKSEQVLVDGDYLYSYSSTQALQGLAPNVLVDQVPQLTATRASIDSGAVTAWDPDCGFLSVSGSVGFEIYTWTNGSGSAGGDVFVSVIDTSTGTTLYRSLQLTTGASFVSPHVAIVGNVVFIVYLDRSAAPGFVRCRRIDLSGSSGWQAQQTLRTDVQFTGPQCAFDVLSLTDRFVIAYQRNTAAPCLAVASFTNAGAGIATSFLGDTSTGFSAVCLGFASSTADPILLAYSGTTNIKQAWLNATSLAITFGPFLYSNTYDALAIAAVKLDANTAVLCLNSTPVPGIPAFFSQKIAINSSAIGVAHSSWGFRASSKPFLAGGRAFITGIQNVGTLSATTFVVDLQVDQNNVVPNHRPVCTIAPRITSQNGPPRTISNALAATAAVGTSGWLTLGAILRTNVVGGLIGLTRIVLSRTNTSRFQMAELGEDLHLTGGVPSYYDGRGVYEIGFLSFVDSNVMIPTPSAVGGSMSSGTYIYAFTYEITDAAGQRHRSAASAQRLVTIGGAVIVGSVAFTQIPSLYVTARQDNDNLGAPAVEIVIYRSTNGGTTLYRLSPESTPTALQSGPSAQYTSYTDTYSDSAAGNGQALATNPVIYTTGGVLDNVCPSTSTLSVVHRGRLWLAGCDDPRQIWFSKAFVTGEAVAFSDVFTFTIEDRNPITALGSLDDVLVIFTRSSIYIVAGDGPADTGVGSNFSTPERVASDVGCIESRSVVLTPDGLMFQGEQGIMILDRSHAVSFIGAPVENTTSGKTISSAIVKPDQNQVVFSVQSSSVNGALVKYDYVQRMWCTDGIFDIDQSFTSMSVQSAARSAAGVYTIVTAFGFVSTERPTNDPLAYLDGNDTGTTHWISLFIQTAWIRFGALQRFQRARKFGLLMNRQTGHKLTVAVSFDYNSSQLQTEVVTDSQFATMQSSPQQPMFRIGSQNGASPRCQSVQLTIFDAPPTVLPVDTGQGAYFTGLSFEIVRKPGLRRVGATAKW